jgi:hypothetical protein
MNDNTTGPRHGSRGMRRRAKAAPLQRPSEKSIVPKLMQGVIHQLRNMVFSISAHADSLEELATASDQSREALDIIHSELTRIERLMRELQEYVAPPALWPTRVIAPSAMRCESLSASPRTSRLSFGTSPTSAGPSHVFWPMRSAEHRKAAQ